MGVYSNVAIASTKEGYDRIVERATQLAAERGIDHPLVGRDIDGHVAGFDVLAERDGCIAFGWPFAKFAGYEGCGYVQAVLEAIDDARSEGHPVEVAIAVDETGYVECPDREEPLALHVEVRLTTNVYWR